VSMRSIASRTGKILFAVGLGVLAITAYVHLDDWKSGIDAELTSAQTDNRALNDRIERLQAQLAMLEGPNNERLVWQVTAIGELPRVVQEELTQLTVQTGNNLRNISPDHAVEFGSADARGLRLEFDGTLDQVVEMLDLIEAHDPPILIEQATLRRITTLGERAAQPAVIVQLNLVVPYALLEAGG
jgi:type II secretion system (T2SS) protein M